MTLGFIGCGNMASAIIAGVRQSGRFDDCQILGYDINDISALLDPKYNVIKCDSENEVAQRADVIVLAVKPNVIANVLSKIDGDINEEKLIISIAAGKTIDFIKNNLENKCQTIRVMPNINAKVCEAISAYTADELVTDKSKQICESIFSSVGEIIYLDEKFFSLYGVLGGCTPALAYMFIDELARAGVQNGMPKAMAEKIAAQAVLGSAKMILESDKHPYELIDNVCSPGGTTIEAITSLQKDGFNSAIHNAVNKAVQKDKLL